MEPNFIQSREKRAIKTPRRDDEIYYFASSGKDAPARNDEESPSTSNLSKEMKSPPMQTAKRGRPPLTKKVPSPPDHKSRRGRPLMKKKTPAIGPIKVRDDWSMDLQPTVCIERLSENDLIKEGLGKITEVRSMKRPKKKSAGRPRKIAKVIPRKVAEIISEEEEPSNTSNGMANGDDFWNSSDVEIKEEPLSDEDPNFEPDGNLSEFEDEDILEFEDDDEEYTPKRKSTLIKSPTKKFKRSQKSGKDKKAKTTPKSSYKSVGAPKSSKQKAGTPESPKLTNGTSKSSEQTNAMPKSSKKTNATPKPSKRTNGTPRPSTPAVDKVVSLPNNRMYFEFTKPKKKVILHIKPSELYSESVSQEMKSQTLEELIQSLKSRGLLSSDAEIMLESFRQLPSGLKRITGESNERKVKQFPEAVVVFANVLYLYCPKAYEIVNLIFHLPGKEELQSRLRSKGYWPGFSQEALELLKVYEPGGESCSIMFDFVPLQRSCDLDPASNTWMGYTDLSGGLDPQSSDTLPVASEVLLFTVVGLTQDWKIPFGYFPCDSLTAETLKNLVIEAIRAIQDCGLKVRALVCDGSMRTTKMAMSLGCHIQPKNFSELLSGFPHPLEAKQEIHLVFGITQSINMLKNLLSDLKVLRSITYGAVRWDHISKLLSGKEIQQKEEEEDSLNSDYQQLSYLQRVSSFCQATFSSMLNKVFELIEDLQLKEYEDCEATANFVADICRAFDLLNLRNPLKTGEKPPITNPYIAEQLEAMLLIGQRLFILEKIAGGRINQEGRWISVTLLPLTLKAVTAIASNLLSDKHKYVTTYRLNLDHSDMILKYIQRCGGWEGLPTASDFSRGYRAFFKSFVEGSSMSPYNNDYDGSDLTIGQGVICPFRRQVHVPKFSNVDFQARSRHLVACDLDEIAVAHRIIKHISSRLHCTECMALMLHADNALCKDLKPSSFILKLLRISDSILKWKRIESIFVNVEDTVVYIFNECLHLLGESDSFRGKHITEEPWHVISLVKVILRTFVDFRLNGLQLLLSVRSSLIQDSRKSW